MSVPASETVRLRVQILGPLRVWRDGRDILGWPIDRTNEWLLDQTAAAVLR